MRECRPRPRNRSNRYRYITADGGGFSSPSAFVRERGRQGEKDSILRSIDHRFSSPPSSLSGWKKIREGKSKVNRAQATSGALLLGFSLFTLPPALRSLSDLYKLNYGVQRRSTLRYPSSCGNHANGDRDCKPSYITRRSSFGIRLGALMWNHITLFWSRI